jgi:predicted O-methyltransferase YrrM
MTARFDMQQQSDSMDKYDFTCDWLWYHIDSWKQAMGHLVGQPVRLLEVGSYEGRATVWLLGNVLTHEDARIDCVDVFHDEGNPCVGVTYAEGYASRFDHNIRAAFGETKVHKIRGRSQEVLRGLPLDHYDAIYLDGSHLASDVLEDAVLAFRLLKPDGVMIIDDYEWNVHLDPLSIPKMAVDAFLAVYQGQYELLSMGYQVCIRKR